jgi:outer membrane receptor protein involved in Fe transport
MKAAPFRGWLPWRYRVHAVVGRRVQKRTFGENRRLQLRAEVFNVFNRRNFTVIPNNVLSPNTNPDLFLNFGQTDVPGRTFLFGARYFF